MVAASKRTVVVAESGEGPYGQSVTIGPHEMRADEAESLGGRDAGPSPYEYVMAGLGACTVMTLRIYASRHGWLLERATVEVCHVKVAYENGATPTDRFQRIVGLTGNLTDEQRAILIEIANRCPVSQTLRRASSIVTSLADLPKKSSARSVAYLILSIGSLPTLWLLAG
jgi:putative redox protein